MRYQDRCNPSSGQEVKQQDQQEQQQGQPEKQKQQEQANQLAEHERAEIDTCSQLRLAGAIQLDKQVKKELFVGQAAEQEAVGRYSNESSIDSQSILTNKLKLKKFWEEKMELDLKSASGQQELQLANAPLATLKRHPVKQARQIKQHDETASGNKHDENNNQENNCQPDRARYLAQESAQPGEAADAGAPASVLANGRDRHLAVAAPGKPTGASTAAAAAAIKGDSNQGQTLDEQQQPQLMSIDPSLCHSNLCTSSDSSQSEQLLLGSAKPAATKLAGSLNSNNCDNNNDDKSSQNVHEEQLDLREEQSAQEEFSSSNSSFGPMSISVSVARSNLDDSSQVSCLSQSKEDKTKSVSDQEDEELNSTQSGSVLTVITKPVELKPTYPRESNERANLEPRAQAELAGVQHNNHVNDDALDAEHDDDDDDHRLASIDKVNDEDTSNIGVAFESLHFDTEVKSSRSEKVEGELLLTTVGDHGGARSARPRTTVAGAREVKSVCNLIAAAISDASRQVDSLVNGKASSIQSNSMATHSPGLEVITQSDASSSIERATFVQEPSGSYPSDELNLHASLESPRADLSSIFEANVRREIERFESNSSVRKAPGSGSKALNSNGITERRIAEEIRSFNEREMELKQRYQEKQQQQQQVASPAPATGAPNSKATHETIVRFGTSFQIPKATACSQDAKMTMQAGKAIKLSSSGGPKGSQATISMHKFIASGGRRFVVTKKLQQQSGPHLAGSQQLTKSMLNLAGDSGDSGARAATRADYKAVDSLNCKETPNVKPGLTRMVIETFSRMSDEARNSSASSAAALPQADSRPPGRTSQSAKSWAAGGWARMREAQSPIS